MASTEDAHFPPTGLPEQLAGVLPALQLPWQEGSADRAGLICRSYLNCAIQERKLWLRPRGPEKPCCMPRSAALPEMLMLEARGRSIKGGVAKPPLEATAVEYPAYRDR